MASLDSLSWLVCVTWFGTIAWQNDVSSINHVVRRAVRGAIRVLVDMADELPYWFIEELCDGNLPSMIMLSGD